MNEYMEFTRDIFAQMQIQADFIGSQFILDAHRDLGLRASLFSAEKDPSDTFLTPDPDFVQKNIIYKIFDPFECSYIVIPSVKDHQILMIGPYLSEPANFQEIKKITREMEIPAGRNEYLNQYFSTIPLLPTSNCVDAILDSLAPKLYEKEHYEIQSITIPRTAQTAYNEKQPVANRNAIKELEMRYSIEGKMMDAIARGDEQAVNAAMESNAYRFRYEQRASNTLRNSKNYMIIVNTLYRKAVQRRNVHPVYLDQISRRYAIQIENMNNMNEGREIQRAMIHDYCELVLHHTTSGHTKLIQDILNYIAMFPSSDLSLDHIADQYAVNKCYLSTQFHKEMKINYSEYVNQVRIDNALKMIDLNQATLQEIAEECGYHDLTYFSKVFKKQKGMSPSAYREITSSPAAPKNH